MNNPEDSQWSKMNKEEFYSLVYKNQTKNRGLLSSDQLIEHFKHASNRYYCVLSKYLPDEKDAPMLDIACGYGNFLYFFKQNGFSNFKGIDFDSEQVELAQGLGLNAELGNWKDLKSEKKLELISALDFLEHLRKEEMLPFLNLFHSNLSVGGRLILRVPNASGFFSAADYFNDLTHEWSFTESSLRSLLMIAGFELEQQHNDRPRFKGILGIFQGIFLKINLILTKAWLAGLGLPMPKCYTRSFWVIAKKINN